MRIEKEIRRRIRHQQDGVNLAADISGAIVANVNEGGGTVSRVVSHNSIVQRSGRSAAQADPTSEQSNTEAHP